MIDQSIVLYDAVDIPVRAMCAIGKSENFTKRMYVDLNSSGANPLNMRREAERNQLRNTV